ncbi:unnamed protein product [Thlaspi arvense]|uniref:Ribosomal protein S15 n=1 Tax=Thlaspi arvense TaxID=13288 RepID=A0AAU9T603_THLAR|nr:unnamed protein product [Thlaspi arvense]
MNIVTSKNVLIPGNHSDTGYAKSCFSSKTRSNIGFRIKELKKKLKMKDLLTYYFVVKTIRSDMRMKQC